MKKLKILVLSDYAFVKGGAEKVAITSSIALSEKGHEVVFFSAVGPVSNDLKNSSIKKIICLEQKDILESKNKLTASITGICNFTANKILKSLLKEWHPDIAHVHGVSKSLSWSPINVLSRFKIPIVYTLHDYGLLCPNLGIYDYKKDKNCLYYQRGYGLKCLFTNCDKRSYYQKLWRWLRYFITRYLFRVNKKVDGFIAVSNFIADIFLANNYLKKNKVRVIYNPIDTPGKRFLKSIKKNKENDKVKFLFVGRLSREKGVDILVDAMEDLDEKLTVIGDGELFDYCKNKSLKLGSNKIKMLGYQDKETVFKEMSESISLILPSRCMEPAPLVPGEAAYCSLTSIVSDIGGIKEMVKDGISGFYFRAGDLESLKKIMKNIIRNPDIAEEAGKEAKRIISNSDFNIATHTERLLRFYNDIINGKNE